MRNAEPITDAALVALVASKQHHQGKMNTFAIRRSERIEASRPGREKWARGVRQTVDDETDELVARYSQAILAKAHEEIRLVDPVALEREPIHLVDFDAVRAHTDLVGGFTMARGVFDVLRHSLPADAGRGPVIALNVRAELRDATRYAPAAATEEEIVAIAREWVTRTSLHEWAHVVAEEAAGRTIRSPIVLSHPERLEAVALALETPPSVAAQAPRHPPEWVRARYHATRRAGRCDQFLEDAGRYYRGPAALAAALYREGIDSYFRTPLVEILRQPAPAAFLALAHQPPESAA